MKKRYNCALEKLEKMLKIPCYYVVEGDKVFAVNYLQKYLVSRPAKALP